VKKFEKVVNGAVGDEITSGNSEVITDVKKSKKVEKTKSGKCKKITKETVSKVENDANCNARHSATKKKKSVNKSAFNGYKIKSKTDCDTVDIAKQSTNESFTAHTSGDLIEGSFQQSTPHTKDGVSSCSDKKQRKRKNKDNNSQDEDGQRSKKRKTDDMHQSDKTVISSIQPGAFENFRISQTMADSLRCT